MKKILVTGGMGYIGSHTCVELSQAGYLPIIVDNLENSKIWIKDRLLEITGVDIPFYQADCADSVVLNQIFEEHHIEGVIHFAANKAVGESVQNPLKYYHNNINSLLTVLEVSEKHNCQNLVFSSSCTVYGEPDTLPVDESATIKKAESPYGSTKIFCETIIEDFIRSSNVYKSVLLRYFNPIGAHHSSLIGELPLGVPSNLVPFITQTAAGLRDSLVVFGNNYNTADGSCIRDFIHVSDLAQAHVKAFEFLFAQSQSTCTAINIGTGQGYSVLQLIQDFEKTTGVKLNYTIGPKRAGDVEAVYADARKAKETLQWEAKRSIKDSLRDAWNWEKTLLK
ncbi:UDP-glucose 4-epimerase GalE [Reichenbachiella sp. 5M10]|uniref:UDP-glucose 4-epimerase GalE n=1 Tax=Reichenbachiella sp. 5M10 TaxID=1889772 RepID=UPI000C14C9DB|nr:UDP-glucose 4-epimerase GalE [Reichenbachiella sp. 5M10]PIB36310.1 UDP-glucose 4-epimerase GalE [Reichenbachiella sp. 5M10]